MAQLTPADLARMRVVFRVPGMDRVRVRRDLVYREVEGARMTLDVYLPPREEPADGPAGALPPVVLLIHGGPVPPEAHAKVKGMGVFVSYGEMLAASGMAAVAFNHLHHGWHDLAESADNVAAVVAYLRAEKDALRLDPDRLCLWAFSGGGPQLAPPLTAPDPAVRCLVGYYPMLDLRIDLGPLAALAAAIPAETLERFSPAACLAVEAPRAQPPLLLARAGLDQPFVNHGLDGFVQAALAAGLELELLNHAGGQHGFDLLDDVERSRRIIARTIEFIQAHCGGQAAVEDLGAAASGGAGASPGAGGSPGTGGGAGEPAGEEPGR
jgi:acetyl esterase/lipase